MDDKDIQRIETHGDFAPGIVEGNYTINQHIIQQHDAIRRKRWRGLESLCFAGPLEPKGVVDVFMLYLVCSAVDVFRDKGYVRFCALSSRSTIAVDGAVAPCIELICHQAEFMGAIKRDYLALARRLSEWEQINSADEVAELVRQDLAAKEREFSSGWGMIDMDVAFPTTWTPLEITVDPAKQSISVVSNKQASTDLGTYPDGLTTTSEFLTFVGAILNTSMVNLGDYMWLEKNYALKKFVISVLDNQGLSWGSVRVNADDYEDWDYINTALDEEIEADRRMEKSTGQRNRTVGG